jgi:hypothetical protein
MPAFHRTVLATLACASFAMSASVAQDAPPAKKHCVDANHRQFDFWIGDWDVFLPDGSKAGENRIESVESGCVLQETWRGRGGVTGRSLNIFDADDRRWHQTWVDSTGGRLDLAGGLESGAMVMSAASAHPTKPGVRLTQRITWSVNADGTLRQLWQNSEDGGTTWTTVFDGRYVKKKP